MNNYKAMDIANYIVDYVNNTLSKNNLTPIKLQKIMYYVYVSCLVKHNIKLFNQPIEKWKFGPVISDVYHNFKAYGTKHIDLVVNGYEFTDGKDGGFSFKVIPFDKSEIEKSPVISLIQSTINDLIDIGPFELVEKTHREDPWKNFESRILNGEKSLYYSDDEIKSYFYNRNII
ncbi:type II toxin-antitoxin system antitoxin SocA domain-containing protein [uncultured Acinetobacter sp.]|uniref:Panacea domain-containing protein n=1 Tax=uncultured Acinetobacter sp. TaxID=165433 RepID=UPI00258ABCDB|nr:type II toxin-antitoxin system antitoxin SocA domain-containing protein [uncultured Acinetobacter sp.]